MMYIAAKGAAGADVEGKLGHIGPGQNYRPGSPQTAYHQRIPCGPKCGQGLTPCRYRQSGTGDIIFNY